MIGALSLLDSAEAHEPRSLIRILLRDSISSLRTLLESSPTGILITGSDHFTRASIIKEVATDVTTVPASRYVLEVGPREKLPRKGVICIEDLDLGEASLEGAVKGLFLTHGERVIVGLASSDTRVPSSLLRAGRFERVCRVKAPSIRIRQEAWQYILYTILRIHHQFQFPDAAATELASISPGYGLPDFINILHRFVSLVEPDEQNFALFQKGFMTFESLQKLVASHEPMSGSVDLGFVTSSAHVPSGSSEVVGLNWGGHAGYASAKESLVRLCEWPVTHYDSFQRLGVTPPRGVLLHGPHGCGKTMVALAFLRRLQHANWLHIHAPDLFSKYLGESEAHIRSLFARARQLAPCVVFIDELDAIGTSRNAEDDGSSGVERRVLGSLLTELDGVTGGQLFVLACASDIKKLDAALVRPGRLDHILEIGLPQASDRRAILEEFLAKVPTSDACGKLIDLLITDTAGMTGADLAGLCREATMLAVEDAARQKKVTHKHFKKALQGFKSHRTVAINQTGDLG